MHGIIADAFHPITRAPGPKHNLTIRPPRRQVGPSHRLRIYQTIEEVRDAVRDFIAHYNTEWLIEKNGLRSPSETRAAWHQTVMRAAA
jgi:hypothetical protein